MQRRGYLAYGVRGDIAPLLVTRPWWTRLNLYAVTPDSPPHMPVTEAVIAYSYFSRLRARLRKAEQEAALAAISYQEVVYR